MPQLNDIYKPADDPTPFRPLFTSVSDPDPDKTLNAPRDGIQSFGGTGRTNRQAQERTASMQADKATDRAQSAAKAAKLKLAKKKRGK